MGKTNSGREEKRRGRAAVCGAGNPIAVAEPRFVVVDTSSLATAGGGAPAGTMYSAAAALVAGAPAQRGNLQIIATHERVNGYDLD
jgi:hypothetical protein